MSGPASGAGRSGVRSGAPWQASFVILAAIWGCSFWWIKLGLRAVSPIDVAFFRLALGAAALLAISAATRTPLPRRTRTWGHLLVLAFFMNALPFTMFAYGETHISSVLAGLINALTPLATLVVTLAIFHQERATPRMVAGLLIGFTGVLVVIGIWRGFGHGQLLGIAACLLGVACYGVAFNYARRHLSGLGEHRTALATGQVLCGTFELLPFAIATGRIAHHPSAGPLLALVALGVLGTGVAYILNVHVLHHAPATIASSVTYFTPIFAIVMGAVFLHETLAWNEPVGAALVIVGAVVTQRRLRPSRTDSGASV